MAKFNSADSLFADKVKILTVNSEDSTGNLGASSITIWAFVPPNPKAFTAILKVLFVLSKSSNLSCTLILNLSNLIAGLGDVKCKLGTNVLDCKQNKVLIKLAIPETFSVCLIFVLTEPTFKGLSRGRFLVKTLPIAFNSKASPMVVPTA